VSYSDWTRVYELWEAGESAYGAGQHRAAAEFYRQATAVVESSDAVPAWYKGVMRRSHADELTTLERLREALAVLSALPKTAEDGFRACCIYGGMTDQIEIAQRLPVKLSVIENAYTQAEDYFRSAGEASWRGRLHYYRSELLYERGLYARALAAAQEGAAHLREDCPKLYPSTHMWGLFKISLASGDLEGAKRYLDRWVEKYGREEKRNSVRGSYEYLMRSRLARAEGRAVEAVEWSRAGALSLASGDWGDARFALACEQVRAYLFAGQHALAGGLLARLAPMRRSESSHRRYALALLLGDYHLARARAAAGLPQIDDEFGTPGEPVGGAEAARSVGTEAARARRAYGAALKVGAWIDERLECSWRTEEVERRLARLFQLE
jgi:tetratricopeptide (TPR) repeat protein